MIVCVHLVGVFAGGVCGGKPGMLCCCCWLLRAFASLFDSGGAISSDLRWSSAVCICCASSGCVKYDCSRVSAVVVNVFSASLFSGCFSGWSRVLSDVQLIF